MTGRHKRCMLLVGDINNKTILDIGCSFGWFEKFAVKMDFKEIIAIDSDEEVLNQAKYQVHEKNVAFVNGSASDLSGFEDDYFDCITMFDVIEHVPKNTEIMIFNEIKRVLKKDGLLFISTPNKNFWSNLLDPAWYFGHRHYSKDKILELLDRSGFQAIETSIRGGFYELFSMILLYIFKWGFRREMPLKRWWDKKRDTEYLTEKKGFVTLFLKSKKKNI